MEFIAIETERTTALTDAVLAILVFVCAFVINKSGDKYSLKSKIWICAFMLLALAAVLGAVAHGFSWSVDTRRMLWHPLYLSLGLFMALFVVGVVYDITDKSTAMRVLPFAVALGLVFFVLTLVWSKSFIMFIIYEAAAMVFALVAYAFLCYKGKPGTFYMALGVAVTMFAAGIQASHSVKLELIWQFDHNGVFHLVQMPGVVLLSMGLRAGMLPGKSDRQVQ